MRSPRREPRWRLAGYEEERANDLRHGDWRCLARGVLARKPEGTGGRSRDVRKRGAVATQRRDPADRGGGAARGRNRDDCRGTLPEEVGRHLPARSLQEEGESRRTRGS